MSHVIDGDTFYSKNRRIRLFGVDTPEIVHDSNIQINYYSLQAKSYLNNMIFDKYVNIDKIDQDVYGRDVCKVFVGTIDVSKMLLQEGLAKVRYIDTTIGSPFFTTDRNYYDELLKVQFEAYQNKMGMWNNS